MATSDKCMEWAESKGAQKRVEYFMKKAAIAIIGESGSTEGHAERVTYAKTVLGGNADVRGYAVGVSTNSTIATTITGGSDPSDNDLEFTVNSMINDFAGYDGGS